PGRGPGFRVLRACVAGAVHRTLPGAEDQAHPALGGRAALDRHPTRRDRAAHRPAAAGRGEVEDLLHVRCGPRRGGDLPRRTVDLRHPPRAALRGAGRLRTAAPGPAQPRCRLDPVELPAGTGPQPCLRGHGGAVGKHVDLPDAYLSVSEALRAGGFQHRARVAIRWVESDLCATAEGARRELKGVDAIVVPGGFGIGGVDGKLGALRHARDRGVPTLGLCLGMQSMVIEYARSVLGLPGAHSTEFDPGTAHPVVATMAEQEGVVAEGGDRDGAMRLGAHDHVLVEGSLAARVYGATAISERHRHRYEVSN